MNWRRFGFIALIITILFGAVILVGKSQLPPILIIGSMLSTTISVATPLTLGALAGIFCERSGVTNIGIEGTMLASAFFGWLASIYANTIIGFSVPASLFAGVVIAIFSGGLVALLHAILSLTFLVDQIISGTVLNILAVGVTGFLNRQLFFDKTGSFANQIPHAPGVLPIIHLPIREVLEAGCKIIDNSTSCMVSANAIGQIFNQKPIALSAILLVIASHYVLFNTRWGLRTRAVGEHPKAADTLGINVLQMRYINVVIGGMLAGLAGAYFTLESVPSFEPMMTNGRGFISLAAMIFGNWTPFGAWMATLLFGASQALQINLQIFRPQITQQWAIFQNSYFVGQLPYILTIIILTGVVGKTVPPTAVGQPYQK